MSRTQYVWVKCRGGCGRKLSVPQGLAISGDEPIAKCKACRGELEGPIHPEHELNADDVDAVVAQ